MTSEISKQTLVSDENPSINLALWNHKGKYEETEVLMQNGKYLPRIGYINNFTLFVLTLDPTGP